MAQSLSTERLTLRRWRESDREPFRSLNADLRVMEFFAAPIAPKETDQAIVRIERHFDQHGFGLYAVELIETQKLIGFIGLSIPSFDAPFMPAVEIGWRLAYEYWGKGLATEGAREVIRHAFKDLKLPSLVSFTTAANVRSRRVMEKIGMVHDAGADFEHPKLLEGDPLRRHVLYRIAQSPRSQVRDLGHPGLMV